MFLLQLLLLAAADHLLEAPLPLQLLLSLLLQPKLLLPELLLHRLAGCDALQAAQRRPGGSCNVKGSDCLAAVIIVS